MFLSVRERAMQIANGQFQAPATPVTTDQVAPPATPKVVPSKIVTTKYSPSKVASSSKTAPPPSTPSKTASRKTATPKVEPLAVAPPKTPTPKTPTPKSPTLKSSSSKTPSSKTPAAKTSSSKTSSSKTATRKTSSSRSLSPKTSSSKSSSPKIASPKIASPKFAPSKPSRPKVLSEMRIGSFAEDPAEENTEISELKAACLKQASGVTGLGGRHLAIVLKRSSSSGEWYAAMKDTSSDKYLKMWMNRSKTFPTQIEALEAYLVFVKKMKTGCSLFPPMSPKATKSKHD